MNDFHNLQRAMREKAKEIADIVKQLEVELKGKRVRIIDEYFNGQPYGSSKARMYGKICIINYIFVDHEGSIILQLKTLNDAWIDASILFDKVELV